MKYEDIIANDATSMIVNEPIMSSLSTPTVSKSRKQSVRTDMSRAISGEEVMNRLRPKLKALFR